MEQTSTPPPGTLGVPGPSTTTILWLQPPPARDEAFSPSPSPADEHPRPRPRTPEGYDVHHVPVLEFRLRPLLPRFLVAWQSGAALPVPKADAPDRMASASSLAMVGRLPFAALIATSPRAITALGHVVSELEQAVPEPQHHQRALAHHLRSHLPLYVVGEGSARVARALGFHDVRYPPPQEGCPATGATLAAYVLQELQDRGSISPPSGGSIQQAPLLFLSGQLRRDVLPDALRAAGVPLEEWTAYESLPTAAPLEQWLTTHPDIRGWVVLCSPSGAEVARPLLAGGRWRIACIGPTTAQHVQQRLGARVDAVAAQPSRSGMLEAIIAWDALHPDWPGGLPNGKMHQMQL